MDKLTAQEIRTCLNPGQIGWQVRVFDKVTSTNDIAGLYTDDPGLYGTAFLAEYQTAGRGRQGRTWTCPPGKGLLCSVLLNLKIPPNLLSTVAAVAAAEAIGPLAMVKWPNDVVISDKKVAGILVEGKASANCGTFVIGIGINCNQQSHQITPDLRPTTTSIQLATGKAVDRNLLAKRMLLSLQHWLDVASTDPQQVLSAWTSRSGQLGRRLDIRYKGLRYSGTCIGLDAQQGLVLHLDSGLVRFFESGHSHILAAL